MIFNNDGDNSEFSELKWEVLVSSSHALSCLHLPCHAYGSVSCLWYWQLKEKQLERLGMLRKLRSKG